MKSPLVSVIIPCYNCEKYVAEAIESVLAQTYKHLEIIVVNDGSTDQSREVVASFGARVNLVDIKNSGAPKARNLGICKAQGEYIQFLDADDVLLEHKIAETMPYFLVPEKPDVVFGNSCSIFEGQEDKCHLDPKFPWPQQNLPAALVNRNIQTSRGIYHKDIFFQCGGFNIQLPQAQEFELNYRLAAKGVKFFYLPNMYGVKVRYHKSPHRISIRAREEKDSFFELCLLKYFYNLAEKENKMSEDLKNNILSKLDSISDKLHDSGKKKEGKEYKKAANSLEAFSKFSCSEKYSFSEIASSLPC